MRPRFDPDELRQRMAEDLNCSNDVLPPPEPAPIRGAQDRVLVVISRSMLEAFNTTGTDVWWGTMAAEHEGRLFRFQTVCCPHEGPLLKQIGATHDEVVFETRSAYLQPSRFNNIGS